MFDVNEDAYSVGIDEVATGPRVGFLEAFDVAYQTQVRTASQYGLQYSLQEEDWKQTKAMIDAGVEVPPQLYTELEFGERAGSSAIGVPDEYGYYSSFEVVQPEVYSRLARTLSGEESDPEFERRRVAYDEKIAKLKAQYPNLTLRTSAELFDTVKKKAADTETRSQLDRRTFGGVLGDFVGGTLASVNPETDPLNFYTLGVGGAGKTLAVRLAGQVGAQGAVESLNQVTGVQANRRLLGLSSGFQDAATRVVGTALGAGALQLGGEAVAAGVKRLFRSRPIDPSPPVEALVPPAPAKAAEPPAAPVAGAALTPEALATRPRNYLDVVADRNPLSGIRYGKARAAADVEDVTAQLSAWDAAPPSQLRPRVAAAVDGQVAAPRVDVSAAVANNARYQAAKEADPQLFQTVEKLQAKAASYRQWIAQLGKDLSQDVTATAAAMDARLDALHAAHGKTQGKTKKLRIREEIAQVKRDREELVAVSRNTETADIARVRQALMRVDEQLRDAAPEIARAYARGQGQWKVTDADVAEVRAAVREGREPQPQPVAKLPDYDTAVAMFERVPQLQRSSKVEPGATVADTVRAVLAEDAKVAEAALDQFRTAIKNTFAETADGKLTVEGRDYVFDLDRDKIFVANENGVGGREVTMRELLEDTQRADQEVEAVSICSMRKTS